MKEFFRKTWAEIYIDALEYNYSVIKGLTKAKICCVVKADAYGHGAVAVAKEYERLGADFLAVSSLDEAMQIRNSGVKKPILILGYTDPLQAKLLSENNISQCVFSYEYAKKLSACAEKDGVKVKIHIKIDTGMTRIGFMCQGQNDKKALKEAILSCKFENLIKEGIFTHFAVSDEGERGKEFTKLQFQRFMSAVDELSKEGITFELKHTANSAAVLDYPEYHLDMVRPGIILYGLKPSVEVINKIKLKPAMQLKSVIACINKASEGETVSYGRTYKCKENELLATIPIGYADGYPRALSGKAEALLRGKRVPIVGRICMDQMMLDVSRVPDAKEGDTVTLFGQDGEEMILTDELANISKTINYELVCAVSKRITRVYYKNGKVTETQNYICP